MNTLQSSSDLDRFGITPTGGGAQLPGGKPWWRNWVPIRTLSARHRPLILEHLLQLSPDDRHLRFGATTSDDQIKRYVDSLDFDFDEIFGIYNRRLQLIAMAHLAYTPPPQLKGHPPMVEFGVSVLREARGRGYGDRLFRNAILRARNRGTESLFINALTENSAMLKIAANAGAKLEYSGPDAEAWLQLPAHTVSTHLGGALEDSAGELTYRYRLHRQRLTGWLRKYFD